MLHTHTHTLYKRLYFLYFLIAETSDIKEKELNDVERVDISLLGDQTLKMKISNVESITQFYVQLPSAIKCENIVDQYMADKDTKVLVQMYFSRESYSVVHIIYLFFIIS